MTDNQDEPLDQTMYPLFMALVCHDDKNSWKIRRSGPVHFSTMPLYEDTNPIGRSDQETRLRWLATKPGEPAINLKILPGTLFTQNLKIWNTFAITSWILKILIILSTFQKLHILPLLMQEPHVSATLTPTCPYAILYPFYFILSACINHAQTSAQPHHRKDTLNGRHPAATTAKLSNTVSRTRVSSGNAASCRSNPPPLVHGNLGFRRAMRCMICASIASDLRSDGVGEAYNPTGKPDESRCVRDQILRDIWLFAKSYHTRTICQGSETSSGLYNILL